HGPTRHQCPETSRSPRRFQRADHYLLDPNSRRRRTLLGSRVRHPSWQAPSFRGLCAAPQRRRRRRLRPRRTFPAIARGGQPSRLRWTSFERPLWRRVKPELRASKTFWKDSRQVRKARRQNLRTRPWMGRLFFTGLAGFMFALRTNSLNERLSL